MISEELGRKLESATIADLGSAERVTVDKDSTTIVGGAGSHEEIEARCREIRQQIEKATTDWDREKLTERLAKLAGGVAVIRVGAPTEAEMKNRKEAFDDAISATQAALAEGIVPGGGLAFLRMAEAVEAGTCQRSGDERTGLHILARSLEVPARQIVENAGTDPGVVVEHIRAGTGAYGFRWCYRRVRGPHRLGHHRSHQVVRVALQNAVSVAGVLLLAEATLTDRPDERPERPAGDLE